MRITEEQNRTTEQITEQQNRTMEGSVEEFNLGRDLTEILLTET